LQILPVNLGYCEHAPRFTPSLLAVAIGGTSTLGKGAQLLTAATAFATDRSGADAGMPSSDVCDPIALALAPDAMESVSPDTKRADAHAAIRMARPRSYRYLLINAPSID
jgi:hypothetical protein